MVEIGHGATDRKVTYPTQFRFHLARRNKSPVMCVCSLPASDLSFLLGSISQDERTATRHGCPTAVENACDFNGSWGRAGDCPTSCARPALCPGSAVKMISGRLAFARWRAGGRHIACYD